MEPFLYKPKLGVYKSCCKSRLVCNPSSVAVFFIFFVYAACSFPVITRVLVLFDSIVVKIGYFTSLFFAFLSILLTINSDPGIVPGSPMLPSYINLNYSYIIVSEADGSKSLKAFPVDSLPAK